MSLELTCPCCQFLFHPEEAQNEVDRFDPRLAMEDGQTVEDWLSTTLAPTGTITCPQCGDDISMSETQLSELAAELLLSW